MMYKNLCVPQGIFTGLKVKFKLKDFEEYDSVHVFCGTPKYSASTIRCIGIDCSWCLWADEVPVCFKISYLENINFGDKVYPKYKEQK